MIVKYIFKFNYNLELNSAGVLGFWGFGVCGDDVCAGEPAGDPAPAEAGGVPRAAPRCHPEPESYRPSAAV